MPKAAGQDDHSPRFSNARSWLIAAAVETVLDHCSDADRDRLKLVAAPAAQDPEAMILDFNEEMNQYADLVVQQAIATISMLISKNYKITISKQEV